MEKEGNRTIIIGIGNSGRADDGLGWAFLDQIKPLLDKGYDIEYRYQLQIEDAELISHYSKVYFVDATKEILNEGYALKECIPLETHNFSTHSLSPETVLFLSRCIYNVTPETYVLGISGVDYGLKIGLSDSASTNLSRAVAYFTAERLVHFN